MININTNPMLNMIRPSYRDTNFLSAANADEAAQYEKLRARAHRAARLFQMSLIGTATVAILILAMILLGVFSALGERAWLATGIPMALCMLPMAITSRRSLRATGDFFAFRHEVMTRSVTRAG